MSYDQSEIEHDLIGKRLKGLYLSVFSRKHRLCEAKQKLYKMEFFSLFVSHLGGFKERGYPNQSKGGGDHTTSPLRIPAKPSRQR